MRLTSPNLEIRPLAPGDVSAFCRLLSDPSVGGRLVGAFGPNGAIRFVSTLDAAEKSAMFRERQAETIAGAPSRYAIGLRGGGDLIGSIGSYAIDEERIGLSYWIAAEHQGKGFGTEALRSYCGPALRLFRRQLMLANVETDNAASIRTLQKAGFEAFDRSASPGVKVPAGRIFLQIDRAAAAASA